MIELGLETLQMKSCKHILQLMHSFLNTFLSVSHESLRLLFVNAQESSEQCIHCIRGLFSEERKSRQ